MESITEFLRHESTLTFIWRTVVWACAAFLIAFGALALARPQTARTFLGGFVSSWLVNAVEALLRVGAGLGFMGTSTDMKLSPIFFAFGAILAVTGIAMLFLYGVHKTFGVWAIPFAQAILPLYGVLSIALGGVIVWAMI